MSEMHSMIVDATLAPMSRCWCSLILAAMMNRKSVLVTILRGACCHTCMCDGPLSSPRWISSQEGCAADKETCFGVFSCATCVNEGDRGYSEGVCVWGFPIDGFVVVTQDLQH